MKNIINKAFIDRLLKTRSNHSHKGDYGHTLLVCGSEGMAGAAVLATGGALRSGCGFVSVATTDKACSALLARHPSAMSLNSEVYATMLAKGNFEKYTTIGIGCGIGNDYQTFYKLRQLLNNYQKPIVIDADAINIIALNTDLQKLIPYNSVITPHAAELSRLLGKWLNIEDRDTKVKVFAQKYSIIMVIKGYNTMICNGLGKCYYNTTGNAFLSKAGAGDVLTGLITGLIARGYQPFEAAAIGVYFHGLAGENAEKALGGESYNAADLEKFIRIE